MSSWFGIKSSPPLIPKPSTQSTSTSSRWLSRSSILSAPSHRPTQLNGSYGNKSAKMESFGFKTQHFYAIYKTDQKQKLKTNKPLQI